MKKLLLADGNSMLFRAYYATAYGRPMTTAQGLPTNAVFGFVQMIQKAIETVEPDSVLIAFDAGKHTFRHDLYPEYKGGRKPAPDDLVPQFQMVRDCLDAFGIRWVEMADIEADDLIGTVSKKNPDFSTYILSSDHDLLQLIDETTSVLLMKKGISEMDVMTPAVLKEQMGIEPLQIIDMKGLMGDKSDNIPGIPGIGEKTALKLLGEYGTVEEVIAHEDELKGALYKKVSSSHESALLSKKLATIRRDVDVAIDADDLVFRPDYKSLVQFLLSLDMRQLAARFEEIGNAYETGEPETKEEVKEERMRVSRVPEDMLQKDFALFIDDDRRSFLESEIHGFALCDGSSSVYISLEDALKDDAFLKALKSDTPQKCGFDIKRAMHLCAHAGIEISWHDDAMILAALSDSTLTSTEKIREKFGLSTDAGYEEVYGKPNKPVMLVDEEKQMLYGTAEARNILTLKQQAYETIKEYEMEELYRDMEMPLTEILFRMEEVGIHCEMETLNTIADETMAEITKEQTEIYRLCGHEFNLNSPKQLGEVLFDELGLPGGKKKSTSADKLEKLVGIHPVIEHILTYRKLSKIYSTYAEGLKKYIYKDGRIHTIYNQCATQTGRLSSSEPNLQNISVRDEQGRQIRKAFLPDPGCVLISSDYHQIELRMLADMADEKSLIEAFNSGIDIHTKTAMDVFDKTEDEVTPEDRRKAKTVNFGIVYGISDFGLAEQLGVSRWEAADFIDKYYEKYPGIRTYMNSLVKDCEKNGYVTTLCGRRREIPEIRNANRMVREFGKRAAMNAPIQGSAADLIKLAMIDIDRMMKNAGVKSQMILQVHDELIFNVPEDEIEEMKDLINEGMVNAMKLKVPLSAECAIGKTWYEAK
ncbi:MAG: DNA polymerase I [Erysipelotrichaceae bacterium]|nr:DNA polymerase I [Erysipelotrichaceae bacterium]